MNHTQHTARPTAEHSTRPPSEHSHRPPSEHSPRPPRVTTPPVPGNTAARGWRRWAPVAAPVYWAAIAVLAFAVIFSGVNLPIGDAHPEAESMVLGLVPRTVVSVAVGAVGLILAVLGAWMWHAGRLARDGELAQARTGRQSLLIVAWTIPVLAVLTAIDAQLLAFVGYLPFLIVMAPFDAETRTSLEQMLEPGNVLQVLVVVGVMLWGAATLAYQRASAVPGRTSRWATPSAASRWGRAATVTAAAVPAIYAVTRYAWLVYPLGFDRETWEAGWATGNLWSGVLLGTFALAGTVLTLGLIQRWGEVFPRWIPVMGGRTVPLAAAVVPASLVAVLVVPAGISMIMRTLGSPHFLGDLTANWAAAGPTFLWPLWGVSLGAATLAYYLRRRGHRPTSNTAPSSGGHA